MVQWTIPFILRAALLFFALLVLALGAAGVAGTRKVGFYYGVDAYALFLGIFTLLYVPSSYFYAATIPLVSLVAADVILSIMWFSAFIALAAIHGPEPSSCAYYFSDWYYGYFNNYSAKSGINYCAIGKANAAMAAIGWVITVAIAYFVITEFLRERKGVATPVGVSSANEPYVEPKTVDEEAQVGVTEPEAAHTAHSEVPATTATTEPVVADSTAPARV